MTLVKVYNISKEFKPSQLGETKKVFLKNGSSISTRWKKENEYIICYKPGNYTEYYSPYFLLKFENRRLKKMIPYPNKRSFAFMAIILIGFLYFNKVKSELYLTLFVSMIVFILLLQIILGIKAYHVIKNNVLSKN